MPGFLFAAPFEDGRRSSVAARIGFRRHFDFHALASADIAREADCA
jgi:hypothetical protein